jgi:CelD/BcsL family acetyltransferase involved in cellulose biosynthesis
MGFLLDRDVERREAAEALLRFAFDDLRCIHVELADRALDAADMVGVGYEVGIGRSFLVDLRPSEASLFSAMRATTRNYIRQAERKGLEAEAAAGVEFADEFHAQLTEVFGRQGLVPTYGVERVRRLIRALEPAGQVLLLRIRSADGRSIATAISVGRNRTAVLWGAAFWRAESKLHPNDLLHWEAIRRWRERGVLQYDMGGGGDYKAKYGGTEVASLAFHRSRWAALRFGRTALRTAVRARQIAAGRVTRVAGRW